MAYEAVIGRRYGSAGLRDILIESEVVAEGSVDQLLNGRHYNRAMRAYKYVFEALWRLQWDSFLQWNSETQYVSDFEGLKEYVSALRDETSSQNMDLLTGAGEFEQLQEALLAFMETLGPNAQFWMELLSMIHLLLSFILSCRTKNWQLHIACLQEMLPWLAAYDRTNYTRYLPLYVLDMLRLPETHPDLHTELMNGNFAVQRSNQPFTSIPHDQTIEVTINKDTKVRGGLVGKTLRRDTTNKWIWTAADRATYFQSCKDLCGQGSASSRGHPDGSVARIKQDERAIQKIVETVNDLVNPFIHHEVITHIASGKYATPSIEHDLLEAKSKGCKVVENFVLQRLDSNGHISFYDPIKKLSLRTFATFSKKHKSPSKSLIEQETVQVFTKLYDMGQEALISPEVLLSYELTSIPRSIADSCGAPLKTKKSDLLHILADAAGDFPLPLPINTTHIIDAMPVLQAVTKPADTYEELGEQVLGKVVEGTGNDAELHWVGDTYPEVSIKHSAHGSRENIVGDALKYVIRSGSQRVPHQFKRALRSGPYKEELLKYLVKNWTQDKYHEVIGRRKLYCTVGTECFCITVDDTTVPPSVICTAIPDLDCTHEEADTRMMLHAKYASQVSQEPILLRCPDTDVLKLSVYTCDDHPMPLVFRVLENKAYRYISVNSICQQLGSAVVKGLPGMHSFLGSDSNSQFAGHGKKKSWKLLVEDAEFRSSMTSLGDTFELSASGLEKGEQAICTLYKSKLKKTNQVRNERWNRPTKDISTLPPSQYSAILHLKRANYQAAIWKRCLEPHPNVPSPHGHGWEVIDGEISILWMTQASAPDIIIKKHEMQL